VRAADVPQAIDGAEYRIGHASTLAGQTFTLYFAPDASLARIDYVEAVEDDTLRPVERIGERTLLAVAAWFGLLWVAPLNPSQGAPGPTLVALQTALVMALVAGVELSVFGMLPVRFLPGEKVYHWNRRVWAILLGIAVFGFVHILVNPRHGYLADATRTPMLTIVVLLLCFGLGSVVFWAYFRFRRVPVAPSATV